MGSKMFLQIHQQLHLESKLTCRKVLTGVQPESETEVGISLVEWLHRVSVVDDRTHTDRNGTGQED